MTCGLREWQTRRLARAMFASDVESGELVADPYDALRGWIDRADRAGDSGMVRVLGGLLVEAFADEWQNARAEHERRGSVRLLRQRLRLAARSSLR